MPTTLPRFDWDAHWAESNAEPVPVKAAGKIWMVNPAIPASLVLDFLASTRGGAPLLPDGTPDPTALAEAGRMMSRENLGRFFDATFGKEAFPVLIEKLTMQQLADLMGYVMNSFTPPDKMPAEVKAGPLAQEGSTPSSTG